MMKQLKMIVDPIKLKTDIAILENLLVKHYRPYFLHIESDINNSEDIHIVISCALFCVLNIEERISKVFRLIKNEIPDMVLDHSLIIQCYNNKEFEKVLPLLFEREDEKEI